MVGRLVAYIIGTVVAVLVLGTVFGTDFVTYQRSSAVLVFGILLGVINTFIKPTLSLLTFPISCLTFGVFSLVINAAFFALAAWLTPGIEVTFWGAMIGAVLASIASGVMFSIIDEH